MGVARSSFRADPGPKPGNAAKITEIRATAGAVEGHGGLRTSWCCARRAAAAEQAACQAASETLLPMIREVSEASHGDAAPRAVAIDAASPIAARTDGASDGNSGDRWRTRPPSRRLQAIACRAGGQLRPGSRAVPRFDAMRMALGNRKPAPGLFCHPDSNDAPAGTIGRSAPFRRSAAWLSGAAWLAVPACPAFRSARRCPAPDLPAARSEKTCGLAERRRERKLQAVARRAAGQSLAAWPSRSARCKRCRSRTSVPGARSDGSFASARFCRECTPLLADGRMIRWSCAAAGAPMARCAVSFKKELVRSAKVRLHPVSSQPQILQPAARPLRHRTLGKPCLPWQRGDCRSGPHALGKVTWPWRSDLRFAQRAVLRASHACGSRERDLEGLRGRSAACPIRRRAAEMQAARRGCGGPVQDHSSASVSVSP